jgi:hypothetical protein
MNDLNSFLKEVEERLSKATPGPWKLYVPNDCSNYEIVGPNIKESNYKRSLLKIPHWGYDKNNEWMGQENIKNAEFISQMPTDLTKLIEIVKVQKIALERVKILISGCHMTTFPIWVREQDGSTTMERPKSNEGHAMDEINSAIQKADELARGAK